MRPDSRTLQRILTLLLLVLLVTGIAFRFYGVNWNQDTNLHPDEYGLTNTLTSLRFPATLSEYFNTRLSPISPYNKYDEQGQHIGDGPDNRMRWGQWPILMIRGLAEATGNTGYDEMRLMGRVLVAILDCGTLLLIFLIGRHLYGFLTGLLGAVLSSLAVMQIQQSHFMTVDNFAVFFSALCMYAAVRIAQLAPVQRQMEGCQDYRFDWGALKWFLLFGISLGMAMACKINLLPLAGMVLIAAFISIADLKLRHRRDLQKIFLSAGLFLALAAITSLLTFRVTQPMSFRAAQGDTTFFTLHLNQDWVDSMKVAQSESSGVGGGPPAEQWTGRTAIIFPLVNMVMWGMGLPLGIAAWAGFAGAAWQMLRHGRNWRLHLLPLVWSGGYFLFMATRWVKSMRYFLPIYPFLCLLAAWGLMELLRRASASGALQAATRIRRGLRYALVALPLFIVIGGTLTWAAVFVTTIYGQDHTRIQATRWIFQNIPAPIHLQTLQNGSPVYIPISVPEGQELRDGLPFQQSFTPLGTGKLTAVTLPHISYMGNGEAALTLTISSDPEGKQVLDETTLLVPSSSEARGVEVQGSFQGTDLKAGEVYYLTATVNTMSSLKIYRNIVSNENWDEGLPVRFDGYDPFGQFYQGVTMEVRWVDDENKLAMFEENLSQVDYIIMPSQRSIWSACRLTQMYPMTLEYYRALFDGRLGFDLAAAFQAPFKIGSLWISDVGGTFAWNAVPSLPLFNYNLLAAEEAFSVYDHPPVWIFKKNSDFSPQAVEETLGAIDLSQVVVLSPRDAKVIPVQ